MKASVESLAFFGQVSDKDDFWDAPPSHVCEPRWVFKYSRACARKISPPFCTRDIMWLSHDFKTWPRGRRVEINELAKAIIPLGEPILSWRRKRDSFDLPTCYAEYRLREDNRERQPWASRRSSCNCSKRATRTPPGSLSPRWKSLVSTYRIVRLV